MRIAIAIALSVFPLTSVSATDNGSCSVPGHAVQWLADYCMFKEETDDLIAASSCMELERDRNSPTDECAAKLRYKTRLCNLHLARRTREGTIEDCVGDPNFSGDIVRNDGA